MAANSAFFFRDVVSYDEKAAKKNLTHDAQPVLQSVVQRLEETETWSADSIHNILNVIATEANVGLGKIAQPIRVAVTGTAVSPPIDSTLALLGKRRTIERIGNAIKHIGAMQG